MELELPKNQDVNIMKKTDEECGKDQQFKVLSPAKPVTMIELKAIQQKFKLYQGIGIISQDQIKLRTEVLRIARCVEAGYLSEVNEDMLTIIQELTNYAANLLHNTINNYEDIEFLFQNGFFIELLDLIRRTHVDKIPDETLRTMAYIAENGTAEQTQKMFETNTIYILAPKLKSKNYYIQRCVLWTFYHIIRKGWMKTQQSLLPYSNEFSLDNQSYYSSSSSSNSNQSQSSSLQFADIPSKLQKHFLLPHPYLFTIEKQGVYRKIIEDIIANKEVELKIKIIFIGLLDMICCEGVKLPSDIRSQIIKDFCNQAKSDNDYINMYAMKSLIHLSMNKDNLEVIQSNNFLDSTLDNLSSITTKKLIRNAISAETLNELKNNKLLEQQAIILESIFADPETLNKLMKILRSVSYKIEEKIIEMIDAGLLDVLKQEMNKLNMEEKGKPGKIIIISLILQWLSNNNIKVNRKIIEEIDFIEKYISLLSSIPMIKINDYHLEPLYRLSSCTDAEYNQNLNKKGLIQLLMNTVKSENICSQKKSIEIMSRIIKTAILKLEVGVQHPYLQSFANLGILTDLIELFINEEKKDIRQEISVILATLFKAAPLPSNINKNIIIQLEDNNKFHELALLAECQANHNMILENNYEINFFSNKIQTILSHLQLIYILIQFGTNEVKKKIVNDEKDKVERLTTEEQLNQLMNKNHLKKEIKEEIKLKANEILSIIKNFEFEQNDTTHLISDQQSTLIDEKVEGEQY